MGYKPGNYDNHQAIDPASCPTLPDKIGRAAAYGLMGYGIGKMTVRRSRIGGFLRAVKETWDEPDWRKRAARRR